MFRSMLAALAATAAGMPAVIVLLRRRRLVDVPNERSSHERPTLRGGGIAVAAGIAIAGGLTGALRDRIGLSMIAAALAFGVLGLTDDIRRIPATVRLVAQFALAAIAVGSLLAHVNGPIAWQAVFGLGAVVWIVAYVNAFNFMDGINGLSAAQALTAGVAWWVIGAREGVEVVGLGGAIVVGAALGFAPFNFPRATIFLGDVGSYCFGAWIGCLALIALRSGLRPEAVFAPLALYLADTGWTIVRRVRCGEVWHEAHRDHAYQRLVRAGLRHDQVTLGVGATMALTGALGVWTLHASTTTRVGLDVMLVVILGGYLASPSLVRDRDAAEQT